MYEINLRNTFGRYLPDVDAASKINQILRNQLSDKQKCKINMLDIIITLPFLHEMLGALYKDLERECDQYLDFIVDEYELHTVDTCIKHYKKCCSMTEEERRQEMLDSMFKILEENKESPDE